MVPCRRRTLCLGRAGLTGDAIIWRVRVDLTGELDGEAGEARSISAKRCLTIDFMSRFRTDGLCLPGVGRRDQVDLSGVIGGGMDIDTGGTDVGGTVVGGAEVGGLEGGVIDTGGSYNWTPTAGDGTVGDGVPMGTGGNSRSAVDDALET